MNLNTAFLQATSVRHSARASSEVSSTDLAHDSISRWLKEKNLLPKRLWQKVKDLISDPGILVFDDTVINKNGSEKIESTSLQHSGTSHSKMGDIHKISASWYNLEIETLIPIDFRIFDRTRNGERGSNNRNDFFREMVEVALDRGLKPLAVVMDSWYAGMSSLKFLRKKGLRWVSTLKKNRLVDLRVRVEDLEIPKEGRVVHLRAYGKVKVVRIMFSDRYTDCVATNALDDTVDEIEFLHKIRWAIEAFRRETNMC